MAYEKSLAGGSSDHATTNDSDHIQQTPNRRRWTDVLMHRWPTALGVAVAALAAFDVDDGLEFAALTVLMALVYLGAAALDRRWIAWVVLLAGLAFLIPRHPRSFLRWFFSSPHPSSWCWGSCVGNGKDTAASRSRPPGCSPLVRPCW